MHLNPTGVSQLRLPGNRVPRITLLLGALGYDLEEISLILGIHQTTVARRRTLLREQLNPEHHLLAITAELLFGQHDEPVLAFDQLVQMRGERDVIPRRDAFLAAVPAVRALSKANKRKLRDLLIAGCFDFSRNVRTVPYKTPATIKKVTDSFVILLMAATAAGIIAPDDMKGLHVQPSQQTIKLEYGVKVTVTVPQGQEKHVSVSPINNGVTITTT